MIRTKSAAGAAASTKLTRRAVSRILRPVHRLSAALLALLLAECANEASSPGGDGGVDGQRSPAATAAETPASTPTPNPTQAPPPELVLDPVASGFDLPSGIAVGPGGEIYVNETRSGLIRVVDVHGTVRPEPFLDMSDEIRGDGERGLLGLSLHPAYESNRRFFVHYTRRSDGAIVISEFAAKADGDPRSRSPNGCC